MMKSPVENLTRRPCAWMLAGLAALIAASPATAEILTPLASYEPAEADLTVARGGADTGLTVSIVPGGTAGAPVATDGDYVVKLEFAGEDGKIEFRHQWSGSTYDLAGQDRLLADVYVASSSALPGIVGIWSSNWSPPDAWESSSTVPEQTGEWTTVRFNVLDHEQTDLDNIWAFVLEDMPGSSGTIYVDNLRFERSGTAEASNVAALGLEDHVALIWNGAAASGLDGYNVYRSSSQAGPFTQLNAEPVATNGYVDPEPAGSPLYFYYVTTVVDGIESPASDIVSARYNGLTDDELMDIVQLVTFWYFWDLAHPNCGLAREGYNMGHNPDIVTSGGTGMGLITIMVAVDRGFVSRADAAARILQILTFLDETAERYHGAWPHHMNGVTGATIPFATYKDNGGDLVETAFLVEGMLAVRQYFDDPVDPVETEIRTRATAMWEGVEWDWYRQYPGSDILYWHWSPDYGWDMNHAVRGFNEAMMVYILAVASPTHPMPPSCYYNGWTGPGYYNGNYYYGYQLCTGPAYGGSLFTTHYSFMAFDPRFKRDAYCDYFEFSRNMSLIQQAYSMDNPNGFEGYNAWTWGLTASFNPWGYSAHSVTNDNGTIAPTAALSAIPFTPDESLMTMRHFYDNFSSFLWGSAGFYDAFNLQEGWTAPGYVAIDQGPIAPMIENYRTGLPWRMFMSSPEIKPALIAMGWEFYGDFNDDGEIDLLDHGEFLECLSGPGIEVVPAECTLGHFRIADLDEDDDVDLADFAEFERILGAS